MATSRDTAWSLGSFIDSFIHELDKVQDTLSLKGVTRKLSYTVQDVALDLNLLPHYRNKKVRFTMPKPGETGTSKISIQLGSISNRQIKETTSDPIRRDDLSIDDIEDIDEDVRASLREVGVNSVDDFKKMEARNINVEKIVNEKVETEEAIDADDSGKTRPRKKKRVNYGELANLISKARRRRVSPSLSRVRVTGTGDDRQLSIDGRHLVISRAFEQFPVAVLNDKPVPIHQAESHRIDLSIPETMMKDGSNQLQIALDPFARLTLDIKQ